MQAEADQTIDGEMTIQTIGRPCKRRAPTEAAKKNHLNPLAEEETGAGSASTTTLAEEG